MKFDLSLIPTTFDSVHAALAATVAGLFFLQVLFLILAIMAFRKKCKPATASLDSREGQTETAPLKAGQAPVVAQPQAEKVEVQSHDAALQLLSLLQNEARFLDFVNETVISYSDAEIGAAARVVHDGCARVLKQYFEVAAVRTESEGQRVTVPAGFDASTIRLTGNVVGSAPFSGTLVHKGWQVTEVRLPRVNAGHNNKILAPAEVEL